LAWACDCRPVFPTRQPVQRRKPKSALHTEYGTKLHCKGFGFRRVRHDSVAPLRLRAATIVAFKWPPHQTAQIVVSIRRSAGPAPQSLAPPYTFGGRQAQTDNARQHTQVENRRPESPAGRSQGNSGVNSFEFAKFCTHSEGPLDRSSFRLLASGRGVREATLGMKSGQSAAAAPAG
jgi:hypothetical protein